MWDLKWWAPHIKGHFKFTGMCPNHRAKLKSCPKCPSQLSNRKTNKSQGGLWGREQDGSWLFSKGINLAWPSWAEPSFEWLTLYLFCPCNNRISQAPQHPFTLVLSQITRLTFPLLVCAARKKKSPRLFTQSQEAMPRYVCRDKTRDGRQIWEGQWWSRTHTHRNTHSLCPESESRSKLVPELPTEKNTPGYALLMFEYEL